MFGFDNDIPIHYLHKQLVWWVCFSINGFSIKLDNFDEIVVFHKKETFERNKESGISSDADLLNICGAILLSASITSPASLELLFDNDQKIILYDRIGDFENYQITINNIDYIV